MKLLLLLSDEAQIAHRRDVELKIVQEEQDGGWRENQGCQCSFSWRSFSQFLTPFWLGGPSRALSSQNSLGTKIFDCPDHRKSISPHIFQVNFDFLFFFAHLSNNMLSPRRSNYWSRIDIVSAHPKVVLESSGGIIYMNYNRFWS